MRVKIDFVQKQFHTYDELCKLTHHDGTAALNKSLK